MARIAGFSGNVYVGAVTIEDCEDVWNEQVDGDVTAALDTSDYKVGAGANKFTLAAGIANGDIIASEVISADLSGCTMAMCWLKSTVSIATPGSLQLLIDDHAMCASPLAIDIPALVANTWKFCRMSVDLSTMAAAISVGLKLTANDPGACIIRIDHIVGASQVAGIKSWKLDEVVDVQDTTGFDSSGNRTYSAVLRGWSGSFEGFKDGAPITKGQVVGIELAHSSAITAAYRGAALITGVHPSVAVDGMNLVSYDFTGVGPLERPTT